MPAFTAPFRLRIRNDADTADLLVVTSERGGTNPYLLVPPNTDGGTFDPISGHVDLGQTQVDVIDAGNVLTSVIGDASKRPAILGLRCFLEIKPVATWEEYQSGFLVGCRQRTAIVYTVSIGETRRTEQQLELLGKVTDVFTQGTSVIGGPIRGGGGGQMFTDNGPVRFKVAAVSGNVVKLEFVSGIVFVNDPIQGPIYVTKLGSFDAGRVNGLVADDAVYDKTHIAYENLDTAFPTFAARLSTTAGVLTGEFMPLGAGRLMIRESKYLYVRWPSSGTGIPAQPSVATQFDVYVTAQVASERFPMHWSGHPATLAGIIHELAGIPYDAASLTATIDAIGPQMGIVLRPTSAFKASDLLDALFKNFQFSRRPKPTGEMEFFYTRVRANPLPATSIAFTDTRSTDTVVFDLVIDSKRNQLVFSQDVIAPWNKLDFPPAPNDIPADGLIVRKGSWTVDSPDDDADGESDDQEIFGVRSEAVSFPGFILLDILAPIQQSWLQGLFTGTTHAHANALAGDLFARRLRGAPTGEILIDRSVAVKLGEEVQLSLPHQVNTNTVPTSRGGTRNVQITRIAPRGPSRLLSVEDTGTTDVMPTAPTLSLAAASDDPMHSVDITVTNAAAITFAGLVRIEWATGASAPSGAGQRLIEWMYEPPFIVRTPPVAAGSKVWVRAQTTDRNGVKRATAFTAWASVTLTALTAPSSLTRTGNVLNWTTGTGLQEVLWRPASESVDRRIAILPAGANNFNLTPYVPVSTAIVATVRSIDVPPLSGVSAAATISFTTAGPGTLTTPSSVFASRVEGDDYIDWAAAGNPSGTTYHIERSTIGSGSGYSEVGTVTDALSTVLVGTGTANTWYRVRASKAGYTTTAYSSPFLLAV